MADAPKTKPAPPAAPEFSPWSWAGPVSTSLWPGAIQWQKPLFILFLASFAVNEVFLCLDLKGPIEHWLVALLLVSAAANALLALATRLPLQNVMTAGVLIIGISGIVLALGSVTGVPFGPYIYGETLGPKFFDAVPWSLPVLWLLLIVNGRDVARLMMRPWRRTNFYGFWVMGLTALLAVHFDLCLEPMAVKVKQYWLWQPTYTSLQWFTAPWVNFLGWFAVVLAILCLTLPWLINKQPVKRPMNYHPLIQWTLLHVWCLTGNVLNGFWWPSAIGFLGCAIIAIYAVRGARW